jgi:hypothetical protein
VDLPGKPLAPGRYRLVLTARNHNGHTAAPIYTSPFTIKH